MGVIDTPIPARLLLPRGTLELRVIRPRPQQPTSQTAHRFIYAPASFFRPLSCMSPRTPVRPYTIDVIQVYQRLILLKYALVFQLRANGVLRLR